MNLFNKKNKKELEINNITMTPRFSLDTVTVPQEEKDGWIWVEGYKGTKEDMSTHYDFKYELNKQYEIDEEPVVCEKGFHFCRDLADVFGYYPIGRNHRFFKVKALVKKSHYNSYGEYDYFARQDKLAAKAIILTEEIPSTEVLEHYYQTHSSKEKLDAKYDNLIISKGYDKAWDACYTEKIIGAGYTKEFAEYIINTCEQDSVRRAVAIGNLPGLSMDLKIRIIFDKLRG